MLGRFLSGLGNADRDFSPGSFESQLMASSSGVTRAVKSYLSIGKTSGNYNFRPAGPFVAGWNPMQQFVGSFHYSISPGEGGLNLTLSNDTSVHSGSYDRFESHERSSFRPMGTTHQIYQVFVPCH